MCVLMMEELILVSQDVLLHQREPQEGGSDTKTTVTREESEQIVRPLVSTQIITAQSDQ